MIRNVSHSGAQAESVNLTPLKVIRAKCLDCLDCSDGSAHEVRCCPITTCPLYVFRLGKNPFAKRQLSDQQREEMADRMREVRRSRREAIGA